MVYYKIGDGKRIPKKVFLFANPDDRWCFATLSIQNVLAKVWENYEFMTWLDDNKILLWERYGIYEARIPEGSSVDDVRTAYLIARDELIDRGEV